MLQIKQIKNMNSFIVFEKNLYNVYIKNFINKKWYLYSEEKIKKINENDIFTKNL